MPELIQTRNLQWVAPPHSGRFWRHALLAALVGIAGMHAPPVHSQARAGYTATDYARLDNPGATPVIRGLNSANEVAGGFQRDRRRASSALVFSANNVAEEVPADQGAGSSVAYGLNDQGEVVGAFNTNVSLRPFRAVRRQALQELALPPGSNGGIAFALNELGEAAGYASGSGGIRAVWWTQRGDVQVLQNIGNQTARALDLNDRGDIAGVSGDAVKTAVLWPRKGGIVSLGTLPGYTHSEAVSVSDNGTLAGVATGPGQSIDRFRAVLWRPGTLAIQDLGTLPGGTDSRARDVNNRGEVVGTSNSSRGDRAFVWTAATGMRDLNELVSVPGLVMTDALGINRRGDIVVMGHDAQTHAHGEADDHVDHHTARRIFVLRALQ